MDQIGYLSNDYCNRHNCIKALVKFKIVLLLLQSLNITRTDDMLIFKTLYKRQIGSLLVFNVQAMPLPLVSCHVSFRWSPGWFYDLAIVQKSLFPPHLSAMRINEAKLCLAFDLETLYKCIRVVSN